MQIKVRCSCGAEKCPEWAIIELQGAVEVQPSFQDTLQNLEIGILCRPSAQENYTFTVGYHELSGSKVTLKKPFVVLKKTSHLDACQNGEIKSSNADLEVVGIIRHKILFKSRPKALISTLSEPARAIAASMWRSSEILPTMARFDEIDKPQSVTKESVSAEGSVAPDQVG